MTLGGCTDRLWTGPDKLSSSRPCVVGLPANRLELGCCAWDPFQTHLQTRSQWNVINWTLEGFLNKELKNSTPNGRDSGNKSSVFMCLWIALISFGRSWQLADRKLAQGERRQKSSVELGIMFSGNFLFPFGVGVWEGECSSGLNCSL